MGLKPVESGARIELKCRGLSKDLEDIFWCCKAHPSTLHCLYLEKGQSSISGA